MTESDEEGRFIESVASELREPEMLDVEFERRVMAEVLAGRRSRWHRQVTLVVTPARALAAAAGFVFAVALGSVGAARWMPLRAGGASAQVAAAPDTVHVVRFVLAAPAASRVAIVGDFNGWTHEAMVPEQVEGGVVWSVLVPLEAGRHEYAFVVDGERWLADPLAPRRLDEFGTESSIVRVGGEARPRA